MKVIFLQSFERWVSSWPFFDTWYRKNWSASASPPYGVSVNLSAVEFAAFCRLFLSEKPTIQKVSINVYEKACYPLIGKIMKQASKISGFPNTWCRHLCSSSLREIVLLSQPPKHIPNKDSSRVYKKFRGNNLFNNYIYNISDN